MKTSKLLEARENVSRLVLVWHLIGWTVGVATSKQTVSRLVLFWHLIDWKVMDQSWNIGKKITAVSNYVRHNWKLLQQTPTQRSLSALHLTSFHCNFSSWRRLLHLRWWRRTSPVRQGRLFQVLPQGLPRRACYNPWEVDLSVALLWWLR